VYEVPVIFDELIFTLGTSERYMSYPVIPVTVTLGATHAIRIFCAVVVLDVAVTDVGAPGLPGAIAVLEVDELLLGLPP
jgi:hypothetical protein